MTLEEIKQAILEQNPDVTLVYRKAVTPDGQTVMGIDYFGVPKKARKQGRSERAFQELVTYADQYEIVLATTPTGLFGADSKRLSAKLFEYGFEPNTTASPALKEYVFLRRNVYDVDAPEETVEAVTSDS